MRFSTYENLSPGKYIWGACIETHLVLQVLVLQLKDARETKFLLLMSHSFWFVCVKTFLSQNIIAKHIYSSRQ